MKQNEQQTKFEGREKKRRIAQIVRVNSTGCLLQLCKIGIFWSIFLPSLHPSSFWCWTVPNHILLKLYCIDAEVTGHAHKLDVKLQNSDVQRWGERGDGPGHPSQGASKEW